MIYPYMYKYISYHSLINKINKYISNVDGNYWILEPFEIRMEFKCLNCVGM